MTVRTGLIAAALSTSAAAVSAAVWLAVSPANAGAAGAMAGTNSPAGADSIALRDVVIVCQGRDRVLRALRRDGTCPAGHEKLSLEPDKDDGMCELCPPSEEPAADEGGNEALQALERRVRALENAPYFEVVDKDEQPIFRVGPGGVLIFNKSGTAVAGISTWNAGGAFTSRSAAGSVEVSMMASGTRADVRIREEGLVRVSLATSDGGSSLRFPSGTGLIAGIGESSAGSGVLLVGTREGQVKAKLTAPDGRGMASVESVEDVGGLSLLAAQDGGGWLEIAKGGDAAVRMGHINHRYGIVLAGPVMGLPLVPKSGLPGSYFMGCGSAAPPACMPPTP